MTLQSQQKCPFTRTANEEMFLVSIFFMRQMQKCEEKTCNIRYSILTTAITCAVERLSKRHTRREGEWNAAKCGTDIGRARRYASLSFNDDDYPQKLFSDYAALCFLWADNG
jgi:hypothetical protein